MIFAQIGDLFDETTWWIIIGVAWGLPAIALFIRAGNYDHVSPVAVLITALFYACVAVAWFDTSGGVGPKWFGFGAFFGGPILAPLLIFVGWRRRRGKPYTGGGFPIIPADKKSN